jgi:hypothetical protein
VTDTDTAKTADDTAENETAETDETSAADETADDEASGEDGDSDRERPMAPPVDQAPALRNDGALNLGLCHFGGVEEPASVLATRSDGTGWIAVCEKHTKDAEEQGYVIEDSSAANEGKDTDSNTDSDTDSKADTD